MLYQHKVQYYETDKMGIVHHSNFIRWFEEARIDFMERVGVPYDKIEAEGLLSPVLSVECKYLKSVRFGETVTIETRLTELGNARFSFSYRVLSADGETRAEGTSRHCFINFDGKPVSLKRENPETFKRLLDAADC